MHPIPYSDQATLTHKIEVFWLEWAPPWGVTKKTLLLWPHEMNRHAKSTELQPLHRPHFAETIKDWVWVMIIISSKVKVLWHCYDEYVQRRTAGLCEWGLRGAAPPFDAWPPQHVMAWQSLHVLKGCSLQHLQQILPHQPLTSLSLSGTVLQQTLCKNNKKYIVKI